MTAVEWLLWLGSLWALSLAYAVVDVPTLLALLRARWMRGHG